MKYELCSEMSAASIEMQFTGDSLPKLDTISFKLEGTETPGPAHVVAGYGKRGETALAWGQALCAVALALIDFKIRWLAERPHGDPAPVLFHESIEAYPYLRTAWTAVDTPTWIDAIFGTTLDGQHLCKHVFRAHRTQGGKSFEIIEAVLHPRDIRVRWKSQPETLEHLQRLRRLLVSRFQSGTPTRPANPDLQILASAEAIFESEADRHRLSKAKLVALNQDGLAACIPHVSEKLFTIPALGVLAAVVEGCAKVDDICSFTILRAGTVSSVLSGLSQFVTVNDTTATLKRQNWDTVIFDWTDTLVNEFEHDEALCEYIVGARGADQMSTRREQFRRMLTEHEGDRSRLWYDYIHLAEVMGVGKEELKLATRKLGRGLTRLCDVNALLTALKSKGKRLVLATNCHSEVLRWRAEVLDIRLPLFDLVITSDQVDDVRDKKRHFEAAGRQLSLDPAKTVVISDDLKKDLLPAKTCGFSTVWVIGERGRNGSKPPRRKGEHGSPTLPPDPDLLHSTRGLVTGRIGDFCVVSADRVLRLID